MIQRTGLALLSLILMSCGGGGGGGGGGGSSTPASSATTGSATSSSSSAASGAASSDDAGLSARAQLGQLIFNDVALSVSGKQSCATCHVKANGFSANDGLPVPLGGPNMDLPGLRNAPTLMYASFIPTFYFQSDGTPTGGLFRDGRAATLAAQAQQPFITSFEMANSGPSEVVERLKKRPYLAQFVSVFGSAALGDPNTALADIGLALAAYETEDAEFHPFSSKFDAVQAGKATFTTAEATGFAIFISPTKGNCSACHSATMSGTTPAMFTDFTYDNIGIPRNWAIKANQAGQAGQVLPYVPLDGGTLGAPNNAYYDMGLCGPLRTNLTTPSLCGMFRVPTLRNTALRQHLFHNGEFSNLNDAVTWYATRDTNPTRWYRKQDGVTADVPYNDLPQLYDANVNIVEVPYNPLIAPTLTTSEINSIVVFLCTLVDGYDPANPSAAPNPAQCQAANAAAAAASSTATTTATNVTPPGTSTK
jgi:cytochrome c peroxidase